MLDEVDSTSNYAKELLNSEPPNGTVIISKKQSAGRGQQTNSWESPEGGLYYSCIVEAKQDERLTIVTLACGIACQQAINELTGISPKLKWVNDIEINNKKAGGILVESRSRGKKSHLIIGIGLNVNNNPAELSGNIKNNATSLKQESEQEFDILEIAAILSNTLEQMYETYQSGEHKRIKSLWLKSSKTFGQFVKFTFNGEAKEGIVIDISETGELIIQAMDGAPYYLQSNRDIVYT
jgi:BirA family biotin operon repressor/biotin-[acetyl-CoA-carboxylase] ligase